MISRNVGGPALRRLWVGGKLGKNKNKKTQGGPGGRTSRRGLGGALIIYNMLGAPVQRAAAAHLLRVLRHFYPFNVAAPDRVLGTPPGLAGPQKRKRRRKQASC